MPLTRLWQFLLTTCAGLLLLALLLSPVPLRRALHESTASRLWLAQQSATLLLQNSARKWIDTAAQIATDGALQSALDEWARGQSEVALLHQTAQARLRRVNEALKVSFLILTDSRGRVLARVGVDEDQFQDSIIGYPAVADAVRGYRLDDLWLPGKQGERLIRVAAAPVIAPARDRYVGAVLIGQQIGDELAQQLESTLGVAVAFVCHGRVVAGAPPQVAEKALARTLEEARGATRAIAMDDELALLVELPGDAAREGAALLLHGRPPYGLSLRAVLASLPVALADSRVVKELLPPLLGGTTLAFLIGLLLLNREVDGPLARLLAVLQAGAQAQAARSLPRPFRELAVAIDSRGAKPRSAEEAARGEVGGAVDLALSRSGDDAALRPPATAPLVAPPTAPLALERLRGGLANGEARAHPSALLSSAETVPPQAFSYDDASEPAEMDAPQTSAPAGGIPSPPARPVPDFAALLEPSGAMPVPGAAGALGVPLGGGLPARSAPHPEEPRAVRAPVTLPAMEPMRVVPAGEAESTRTLPDRDMRSAAMNRDARSAAGLDPGLEALLLRDAGEPHLSETTTIKDLPSNVVQAAIESALLATPASYRGPMPPGVLSLRDAGGKGALSVGSDAARAPRSTIHEETTAVGSGEPAAPVESADELEAGFRRTYQEFLVTKQRCQEQVEGITYEKFVAKLRQSREQIMKQHRCRAVRFQVYVKDGKAALKAIPVTR